MGRVLVSPSLFVPALHSRESTQLCSGCFSSAASISLFLCPSASAGVAGHSILLAITAQHVRGLGSGKEGLRSGECGRQSLQGSWEQSRNGHVCARHGLGGACGWRQQTLGSGRRRLAVAWRSAVGSGHHTRLLCSWHWRTKTRSSNHGRCGPDPSQETQREDLPGVDGPRGQGSLGGSRSGGWRQVVSGSEVVCGSAGQSPRTVRATSAAAQDGTGVETEVVLHPLVCRGSLVCHVSPWSEGDCRPDVRLKPESMANWARPNSDSPFATTSRRRPSRWLNGLRSKSPTNTFMDTRARRSRQILAMALSTANPLEIPTRRRSVCMIDKRWFSSPNDSSRFKARATLARPSHPLGVVPPRL